MIISIKQKPNKTLMVISPGRIECYSAKAAKGNGALKR